MRYCEDEALHFESALPVDRVEPEIVLDSAPVVDDIIVVDTIVQQIIVRDGWVLLTGHQWIQPPARAPPASGGQTHPNRPSGREPARPFASSG